MTGVAADGPSPAPAADGAPAADRARSATSARREDALRALDRVCDFLGRSEPTNPAPLLIRRAQRLMTMPFMDIIRELAPDSTSRVEIDHRSGRGPVTHTMRATPSAAARSPKRGRSMPKKSQ